MYRRMWGAALTAVAITMSSCSTVPGTPRPEPAPVSEPAAADPDAEGMLAEGVRMAGVLAHPGDIDPELAGPGSSGALTRAFLLVNVGHNPDIVDAAAGNGMLAGYLTYHAVPGTAVRKGLTHGVLRFPDAAAAVAAADDLAEAARTTKGMLQDDFRVEVPLAEAPQTRFSRVRSGGSYASMAFTPYREYVVYSAVHGADAAGTEALTVRAMELQRPLLDGFVATDPAEYRGLSRDPAGVLALAVGGGGAARGAYGPAGAALLAYDHRRLRAVFGEVGMDVMGAGDASVFRTRDEAGAAVLAGELGAATVRVFVLGASARLSPVPSPDVPGARCWSATSGVTGRWFCVLVRGRYVAEVWHRSEAEAFDLVRAQYRALEGVR